MPTHSRTPTHGQTLLLDAWRTGLWKGGIGLAGSTLCVAAGPMVLEGHCCPFGHAT